MCAWVVLKKEGDIGWFRDILHSSNDKITVHFGNFMLLELKLIRGLSIVQTSE